MLAVDTNLVVRLITRDNAAQAERAAVLFGSEEIYLSKTVILETAWVLQYLYKLPRHQMVIAVCSVLGLPNVTVETAEQVAAAMHLCEQGLEFADALHIAGSAPARRFATFDRKLATRAKKLTDLEIVAL